MDQAGQLLGQRELCLPPFGFLSRRVGQPVDLLARSEAEDLEEWGDIGVIDIDEELIEGVRRGEGRIEPQRV